MSEDHRDRCGAPEEATAFEAWVRRLAEETDQSTDEVFEQLLSAHWTLTEIFGLVERAGSESALFRPSAAVDRDGDGTGATRGPRDGESADPDPTGADPEPAKTATAADVDALRAELRVLRARLADVEAALDDEAGSREELTAMADHLDAVRAADRSRVDSLDAYVDEEFGNTRTVLRRLIEGHHGHDDALDAVRSELAALGDRVDAGAAVAELKRRANRLGIERADCDACGSTVRLALLSAAECPQCTARFDGIEPRTRRWFGTDVLTVEADGDAVEPEGRAGTGAVAGADRKTVLPELGSE